MNVRRPSHSVFPEKPKPATPPPPAVDAPLTGLAWALDDLQKYATARKARHDAARKAWFVPQLIICAIVIAVLPFVAYPDLQGSFI